jgi:medium-chain acyl-[acyl-carrier-protein] hydrolase
MRNKLYFEKNANVSKGIRLFCFSYAGGGASVFRSWQSKLGDGISVCPAHYPGHEERILEEPVWEMDVLVTDLYEEIHNRDMDKQPFFLFGHSLGSRVAYELALRFEETGEENLMGIIVSAGRAPNRKEENPIYYLPETEFFEELSRYNRTPPELFANKALWSIFEPALRADFTVAETYCDQKHRKLHVPILALRGTFDEEMTEEDLEEWQAYTEDAFDHAEIAGAHLFIDTHTAEVLKQIKEYIAKKCLEGLYANGQNEQDDIKDIQGSVVQCSVGRD